MRERIDRQPIASSAAERQDALSWAADQALEAARLRERWELRGSIILRAREIVNTFTNTELAMKTLKQLLNGQDMEWDEPDDHR